MSETKRLKPADFRRQAYALIRNCWKTMLLAALLMSLIGWIGDAVEAHGERIAQQAYDAHIEAFYAENPRPADEDEAIIWAYFDESLAQWDAEDRYDKVFLPWRLGAHAINLLDSLFGAVILLGLYTGLTMHLRGGECAPQCLSIGFSRWKTATWLSIRIGASILGWSLLAMVPAIMLGNMLGTVGELIGTVIIAVVAFWATCHYALACLHMAEDAEGLFTTSDYIRDAVDHMNFFTVRGLLRTAWPVYMLMVADIALTIAAGTLPWLSIPAGLFSLVSDVFCLMLLHACYTCIYEELRSHAPKRVEAGISAEAVE